MNERQCFFGYIVSFLNEKSGFFIRSRILVKKGTLWCMLDKPDRCLCKKQELWIDWNLFHTFNKLWFYLYKVVSIVKNQTPVMYDSFFTNSILVSPKTTGRTLDKLLSIMAYLCLFNLMLRLIFFSSRQKKSVNHAKKKSAWSLPSEY